MGIHLNKLQCVVAVVKETMYQDLLHTHTFIVGLGPFMGFVGSRKKHLCSYANLKLTRLIARPATTAKRLSMWLPSVTTFGPTQR